MIAVIKVKCEMTWKVLILALHLVLLVLHKRFCFTCCFSAILWPVTDVYECTNDQSKPLRLVLKISFVECAHSLTECTTVNSVIISNKAQILCKKRYIMPCRQICSL